MSMSKSSSLTQPIVVGIGESLFDCYEEVSVLGGAPINVSIHADALLSRIGGGAVPVTKIGNDKLGDRYLQEISKRGISTRYIQVDTSKPTGRVLVTIDDAQQANYQFEELSAWDALESNDSLVALAGRCHAVAFGTLAQRSNQSRRVIKKFISHATQAIRLFDVNLRQQYYSADVIDDSLRLATAVKLNEEELEEVGKLLELSIDNSLSHDELAFLIAESFRLDWLALTQGANGTAIYSQGKKHVGTQGKFNPDHDADSVGAGDACCAALLCGTLLDWPVVKRLDLANAIGAYVAGKAGATPDLPREILDHISPSLNTSSDSPIDVA